MIHQFKLGGYNIVLDICSGAVHAVDELAYDSIALFETESRDAVVSAMREKYPALPEKEIEACYDQIAALKAQGQLFTPDSFAPMAGKFKEKSAGIIKALCLHVAHTCNLNCSY
jgi:uncharacterized protein